MNITKTIHYLTIFSALGSVVSLHAANISLASTMNASSYIAETLTETFIISNGTGTVGNGYTGDDDSDPAFGSAINLFPRETNWNVGTISYNEALVSGTGTETVAITSIDLGELWTSDPKRTDTDAPFEPTAESDISDFALGLWLFNQEGGITFGNLDAADQVTFQDGVLTSIDMQIDMQFWWSPAFVGGGPTYYDGTFAISGGNISLQITDTETVPIYGPSTLTMDMTGSVTAVPEPGMLSMIAAGLFIIFRVSKFLRKK
ncbi:hypothetical protein P0Y35_06655 [Kiritimatiellaeota bacterium B1221]|nr:hypothetical protein [Kiritimatiellaeota bacterium B1221]